MINEEAFLSTVQTTVQNAFRDLLSNKHLYQSLRLSPEAIDKKAKQLHDEATRKAAKPLMGTMGIQPRGGAPTLPQIQAAATRLLNLAWEPTIPTISRGIFPGPDNTPIRAIEFELPTIRTTCGECKTDEPFNPVRFDIPTPKTLHYDGPSHEQDFVLQYQCQACKGRPITFLVHRSKDKLILCGREPMEIVTVPSDIPKAHKDHFSVAIVAHQSGQTLCAIFMLRVFIEQYWLSFPTVRAAANTTRFSGETMGEEYKKLLPDTIKSSFPTLLETYGQLSAAIHKANADEVIFADAKKKILKHFEALRTFDYDPAKAQPEEKPEPEP